MSVGEYGSGDCDHASGFICQGGSWSPKPQYNGLEFIVPGSSDFSSYNGPVLEGHIAQAGASTQAACDVGTFNPSFYQTSCLDCYQGHYCPETGMSDIGDYLCKEGYLCHGGATVSTPNPEVDSGTGFTRGEICPTGYHCPYYLGHKLECPDGFISEVDGLAFCETCPSGYYCDNQVSTARIACITDSFCDLGMKRQPNCPIGMYLTDD